MALFAERFVTSADGLKLFVRDYPAHGRERGTPVLCIHGLTRSSADFEAIAPRIASKGRRVIAIDVRGRGRSERDPNPERYQAGTYVADTIAILNALDIKRAVFIGTSMGGLITMIASASASERVHAAVLNDIGPVVDPAGLQRIGGYVGKSGTFESWDALVERIEAMQSAIYPDADEAHWQTFARRTATVRGDGLLEFDYDPAIAIAFAPPKEGAQPAPAPDLMPLFQALATRPVLVVRGALSDILSSEGVAAMRAVKPDLDVAEVPRVGHAPTLEEPAAWQAISAFLDRVG
jgi:pimeloyl-ACP methyl ester carboxylesterase